MPAKTDKRTGRKKNGKHRGKVGKLSVFLEIKLSQLKASTKEVLKCGQLAKLTALR